jgi:hypothetical protein
MSMTPHILNKTRAVVHPRGADSPLTRGTPEIMRHSIPNQPGAIQLAD